jgi:hypothetical protein
MLLPPLPRRFHRRQVLASGCGRPCGRQSALPDPGAPLELSENNELNEYNPRSCLLLETDRPLSLEHGRTGRAAGSPGPAGPASAGCAQRVCSKDEMLVDRAAPADGGEGGAPVCLNPKKVDGERERRRPPEPGTLPPWAGPAGAIRHRCPLVGTAPGIYEYLLNIVTSASELRMRKRERGGAAFAATACAPPRRARP